MEKKYDIDNKKNKSGGLVSIGKDYVQTQHGFEKGWCN